MAVAAKKNDHVYAYAPTRVYSYSRTEAVAEAAPRIKKAPPPSPKLQPQKQIKAAARANPHVLKKLLSFVFVMAMAGLMLFVVTRYAKINDEYAAVNTLKSNIKAAKQNIEALNVQLNTSVSIEQAREAAIRAGMGYPTAEQIVRVSKMEKAVTTDTNGD